MPLKSAANKSHIKLLLTKETAALFVKGEFIMNQLIRKLLASFALS